MKQSTQSSELDQRHSRSLAEWITFSVALSLLTTIVYLIGYTWFTQKNLPPLLRLNQGTIRRVDSQFYVPFQVKNSGGEAVESVQVLAILQFKNQLEQTGEQKIDFLAANEMEEGVFVFSQNPQEGDLTLRIASYQKP
jgi:uncharacterized protein (TIGR02588 family)